MAVMLAYLLITLAPLGSSTKVETGSDRACQDGCGGIEDEASFLQQKTKPVQQEAGVASTHESHGRGHGKQATKGWVRTCGGTAGGAICMIPFTWKGVSYSSCTTVDHTEEWCGTDQLDGGRWGNCNCHEEQQDLLDQDVMDELAAGTTGASAGTASASRCPQHYPTCDMHGDCVIPSCADNNCDGNWHKSPTASTDPEEGYNWIHGYDADGSPCSGDHTTTALDAAPASRCPQHYPTCDMHGDCVIPSCADNNCAGNWHDAPTASTDPEEGYNWIRGYDADGSPCSGDHR